MTIAETHFKRSIEDYSPVQMFSSFSMPDNKHLEDVKKTCYDEEYIYHIYNDGSYLKQNNNTILPGKIIQ